MKTRIPPVLIIFALVWFALVQNTQAVSPPPPGGYPNFTTAAGDHALQALTLGLGNTAIGTFSLFSEFLKEHRAFVEGQLKVSNQQKEIDALKEELKEQRYLIQKVSDKVNVSQSTTRVARHGP